MLAVYIMLFYYKNDQKTIFLRQESKFLNSANQNKYMYRIDYKNYCNTWHLVSIDVND